jgi:enoyl-CoA hydratase/carnithine racemase
MPVIAVIHGVCYGGGLQIALGADFRIAAPDADLCVMEAKWGLIPDMTGIRHADRAAAARCRQAPGDDR